MKTMPRILLAALLAIALCMTVAPSLGETAEGTDTLVYFEEMGVYAKIPDTIMFVTRESPQDAALYTLLAGAGVTYDEFQKYLAENEMYGYGIMLTDYSSEFSFVIDRLESNVNLTGASELIMNVYLGQAKIVLEELGAQVVESGVYRGELYDGFWFHYIMYFGDSVQHVIQYSIVNGTRTVNLRVYGFDGGFSPENEEVIRKVFDSVLIAPSEED